MKVNQLCRKGTYFIGVGESSTEAILAEALDKYGDESMAEYFINSGSEGLKSAGYDWARNNHYTIMISEQTYELSTKLTGPIGSPRKPWGSLRQSKGSALR